MDSNIRDPIMMEAPRGRISSLYTPAWRYFDVDVDMTGVWSTHRVASSLAALENGPPAQSTTTVESEPIAHRAQPSSLNSVPIFWRERQLLRYVELDTSLVHTDEALFLRLRLAYAKIRSENSSILLKPVAINYVEVSPLLN